MRAAIPGLNATSRLRRTALVLALLAAFAIVSAIVIPRLQASGTAVQSTETLNPGTSIPRLRSHGAITRGLYGFVLQGFSSGRVAFNIPAFARPGERTVMTVWGGGGSAVSTELSLFDQSGHPHPLGHPEFWQAHRIDVSALARGNHVRVQFSGTNEEFAPQLIADQVQVVSYPPTAIPRLNRWEVAGWVVLALLVVLVALRRLRRDAMLVVAGGLAAFLVWPSVRAAALRPLSSDIWSSAVHAKWLDLNQGLLSGTFGPRSALSVQLFHALTPVTGTGSAGAGTASMLVGVGALVAIYALGRRVAGAPGALAAVGCALLTDPFRLSLSSGDPTGTLVLASCLFLIAVHRVLERGDRSTMIALGVAGALAILAEPTWWPGVLAAIFLLALQHVARGQRQLALGAALLALALVSLPSRVSVAHQSNGDLNGDVIQLATTARNIEFVGRGYGAPPDAQALAAAPTSGPRVGLGAYVLGDHSLSMATGGALTGAYDGLSAVAARPDTGLAGLLAFIIELVGVVLLLMLPRLRLLVLIAALLALVPWFFESRGGGQPFLAQSGFWPAMLAGAGAVAYTVRGLARERLGSHRLAAGLRRPTAVLARRGERRSEPAKP